MLGECSPFGEGRRSSETATIQFWGTVLVPSSEDKAETGVDFDLDLDFDVDSTSSSSEQ